MIRSGTTGQAGGVRVLAPQIPDVLMTMLGADNFDFYLTGSRAFGTHAWTSDWDFFTDNREETRAFLASLGFEQEFESPYREDPNSASVWLLDSFPPVHVQLVDDVERKIKAQRYIMRHIGTVAFYELDKSRRKQIWRLVQNILKEAA